MRPTRALAPRTHAALALVLALAACSTAAVLLDALAAVFGLRIRILPAAVRERIAKAAPRIWAILAAFVRRAVAVLFRSSRPASILPPSESPTQPFQPAALLPSSSDHPQQPSATAHASTPSRDAPTDTVAASISSATPLTLSSTSFPPPQQPSPADSATSTTSTNTRQSYAQPQPSRRSRWSLSAPKKLVTISTRNLVFWNPSPDPQEPNYAFRESMLSTLTMLVKRGKFNISLISQVTTDAEEHQIRDLLSSSGLYAMGLDSRRVLFCDTVDGVVHMVRHLRPEMHVDAVVGVVEAVAAWVPRVVLVKRKSRQAIKTPSQYNGSAHSLTVKENATPASVSSAVSGLVAAAPMPSTALRSDGVDMNKDAQTKTENGGLRRQSSQTLLNGRTRSTASSPSPPPSSSLQPIPYSSHSRASSQTPTDPGLQPSTMTSKLDAIADTEMDSVVMDIPNVVLVNSLADIKL